jgi:hypothetical protein
MESRESYIRSVEHILESIVLHFSVFSQFSCLFPCFPEFKSSAEIRRSLATVLYRKMSVILLATV